MLTRRGGVRSHTHKHTCCAGNNMQASQQYVSSRVSWYTGAFFGQLFQVDTDYGAPCAQVHIPCPTQTTPCACPCRSWPDGHLCRW